MNRRGILKTIAGLSAVAVSGENVQASPTPADTETVRKTIDGYFAGAMSTAYVNVLAHADYDRYHVKAASMVPEQWFGFSQPIGSYLPGMCPHCGYERLITADCKTLLWTNMYRGNQFPPPEARVIERIVFLFLPTMLKEDRDKIISRSHWEFRLANKIVGRAPLAWSPIEGELADLFEFDGKVPKRIGRNDNLLSPGQYVHLSKPVRIAPQQQFQFDIFTEPFEAKGDIDFYVLLDGTGEFAVQ